MVQPPESMGLLCSPVATQGRSYRFGAAFGGGL
ncbi:hypothetical protein C163_10945 [Pseudomonas sp. FGI182]|nr:hypothetical protein C163_10945 [Pseudomonas sp. FGI182]